MINPRVTLFGVVAAPRFELLLEADHAGGAKFAPESFETLLANLIKSQSHGRTPDFCEHLLDHAAPTAA